MKTIDNIQNFAASLGCPAQRDVPMKNYTSFKIGGPADLFLMPKNEKQVSGIASFCAENGTPVFVLGKGSNILVSDSGIRGAVIFTGGLNSVELTDSLTIKAGSGLSLMQLCNFALENSLSGLEFAFGIPGTVGGAAFMNAGAYGGEMKDVLVSCSHVDMRGMCGVLAGEELDLSYRHSAYEDNGFIITSASVRLEKGEKEQIKEKMYGFLARRKEKQPLEFPSAGSTFKRPQGYFAGALIEQCGLKGTSIGGAQVSEKHAGFVINRGGATADDVLRLVELVAQTVEKETGVRLEPEIRFIG